MQDEQVLSPTTLPQKVATVANIYYTPILVFLGCLGNVLTIYVLLRSKMRKQGICQYLSALAVSDTFFLLLLISPWLGLVTDCDLFRRNGFCQVSEYLSYVSCCFSGLLVTGFTIERFIAVVYPLQWAMWRTVQRSRLVVAAALMLSLVANAPVLLFTGIVNGDCGINARFMQLAIYFAVGDTIVVLSGPLLITSVLNAVIIYKSSRGPEVNQQQVQAPHKISKVTRMLLIVSSVFVIFNLPAYIMRLLAYTIDMKDSRGILQAVQQVSQMLFNTNFGINFILYCLSGQNFRRSFYMSVPWLRRRCMVREAERPPNSPHHSVFNSALRNRVNATNEQSRSCSILRRWRFDNTRQREPESIEMTELRPTGEGIAQERHGDARQKSLSELYD